MKKENSLKIILAVLTIVLICLVSFGGIYVKDKNTMKNILPDYVLGMDLKNTKIVKLDVATDSEDVASEEVISEEDTQETAETTENNSTENVNTKENYKKSKKIIEQRIKLAGIEQYSVRLDEGSGSIVIELPESVDENNLEEIWAEGKFEITYVKKSASTTENQEVEENADTSTENEEGTVEEETTDETSQEEKTVIADNGSVKDAKAYIDETYVSYGVGTVARLDITFKSDAIKKFKELKNSLPASTSEDDETNQNTIQITINGETPIDFTESEFLEKAVNGTISLYVGQYSTDKEMVEKSLEEATSKKILIKTEKLPVKYEKQVINNNKINSNISKIGILSVFLVILGVMLVYLIVKYKVKGLGAWFTVAGFTACLTLVLRFTKVQISIASIVSIAAMIIMQFIYLIKILRNTKISNRIFNEKTIEFTKMIIPVIILGVVSAIMPALDNMKLIYGNTLEIASFGMVVFWGIIIFEILNNIITRAILAEGKNK